MENQEEHNKKYGEGYGKRPLWQWILLYLVVGGIIYYLIYYFAYGNRGGSSGQTGNGQNSSYPY